MPQAHHLPPSQIDVTEEEEDGRRTTQSGQRRSRKTPQSQFFIEVRYSSWLVNFVMVKKANDKWRIFTNYTDLNKACPKDAYPLLNNNMLVDGVSGFQVLSFLDAYSRCNQIRMHARDEKKMTLITDDANFCYRVMPLGLKNAGAIYHRLMFWIFKQ